MKIHLHRYGGRVMCGKNMDDVPRHTDSDKAFNVCAKVGDACKTCVRAAAADDEAELDRFCADDSTATR